MPDTQNTFIERKKLLKTLFKFYRFGYSNDDLGFAQFQKDFNQCITDRLGDIFAETQYVIIEQSYVETEWKDMISLHYINTTYASTLLPRTIRIHFFISDKFEDSEYLGFITLRPIEEIQIALSYIFVNWNLIKNLIQNEEGKCQFVGYKKHVHCLGHELNIKTYPLLTQDTIVTCCADVNIITLSRFLAHKFGGKKLEIRDICGTDYNVVYPRQITAERFIELCNKMHIPFKTQTFNLHTLGENEGDVNTQLVNTHNFKSRKYIKQFIDTYIDSNLPVVLFIKGHVFQIVGYKYDNDEGDKKKYLVLDDSGFSDPEGKKRFCYFIDIDRIFSSDFVAKDGSVSTVATDNVAHDEGNTPEDSSPDFMTVIKGILDFVRDDIVTIGIPQSERVYIDFFYYDILLKNMIRQQWNSNAPQFSAFLNEKSEFHDGVEIRSKLIECTRFMEYLSENIDIAKFHKDKLLSQQADVSGVDMLIENLEGAFKTLQKISLPHYLWYTELSRKISDDVSIRVGFCADPTRFYKDTTHLHKVFYNSQFDDDKRGIAIVKSLWE